MRLHTLALSAILSLAPASTLAFAPVYNSPNVARSSSSSLSLTQSDIDAGIEGAKKGVLSFFAASTIFIASSGTPASFVEPAFAATKVAETTTTTTTKKAAPVDPLATEKAAVETAKSQLTAANAEITKTKKTLGEVNTALAKASDLVSADEKKVTAAKKALIVANDKLADAKSKEGRNGGADMNALKEVDSLAAKVGTSIFPMFVFMHGHALLLLYFCVQISILSLK